MSIEQIKKKQENDQRGKPITGERPGGGYRNAIEG